MIDLHITGMMNGWRTKMIPPPVQSNGGPLPLKTAQTHPIGTRYNVTFHFETAAECDAFIAGLECGLMPELWFSNTGKFA